MKFLRMLMLLVTCSALSHAAATFQSGDNGVSAADLANQIEGVGITITNPTITHGDDSQYAIFEDGVDGAGLEIDEGIHLSGMTVTEAFTTNTSYRTSQTPSGTYNDPDLTGIDANAIYNPIIFEFDVTLDENTRLLLLDYQFASEEYNEYVGSRFNDAFGFFVSGGDLNQTYNIARVVDNSTFVDISTIDNFDTVTVNNVNNGLLGVFDDGTAEILTNGQFYIDNCNNNQSGTPDCTQNSSPVEVEYDGLTHTLHATLDNLTPGETYHFKIAIADTGDSQWDTGVFINSINGIREPSVCYDYAYQQFNTYFTEDYNGSSGPRIVGSVDSTEPFEVTLFISNIESELNATNVTMNIFDINTTQAIYETNSVYVSNANDLAPQHLPDGTDGMLNDDAYIKNIQIDDFGSGDVFYLYYSLDPKTSNMDMPINASLTYDITLPLSDTDTVTIQRTSIIDKSTPICSSTGYEYLPTYGAFNIEQKTLGSNGNQYYNLPTQTVNRMDNFVISAYDVNETVNNVHTRKEVNSTVFIELIDADGFHYVEPKCTERVSLSQRVVVPITGSTADFNATVIDTYKLDSRISGEDYFTAAKSNAAFRLSYNVIKDTGALVEVVPVTDGYIIKNFTDLASGVININAGLGLDPSEQNKCQEDVITYSTLPNGNLKTTTYTTMPQACGNNAESNSLSAQELAICMQCVFGYNTKQICSRDNFAIRPESFRITLKDQNQTLPEDNTTKVYIGENNTTQKYNLSAGYQFAMDINATSHNSEDNVPGYTLTFSSKEDLDRVMHLKWQPTTNDTNCNDIADHNITATFINGRVDTNLSRNEVGSYELNITDTLWTQVDYEDSIQNHHQINYLGDDVTSYFLQGDDCVTDSSDVPDVGTPIGTSANNIIDVSGCVIRSEHINDDPNNGIETKTYTDMNLSFLPYAFGTTLLPSYGFAADTNFTNAWTYMANMDLTDANTSASDHNQSMHLRGNIFAQGYSDFQTQNTQSLSNFVTGCYAKDLNLTLSHSFNGLNSSPSTPFQFKLFDYNRTGSIIYETNTTDLNSTTGRIASLDTNGVLQPSLPQLYFTKDLNGTTRVDLNFNFDRNATQPLNPIQVAFDDFNITCATTDECTMRADLIANYDANGTLDLNNNLTYYYGRLHAPRYRVDGNTGTTRLYYEVYCDTRTLVTGVNAGNPCVLANHATTTMANALLSVDDIRWYQNEDHNQTEGNTTSISQRNVATNIATQNNGFPVTAPNNQSWTFQYNENRGYPYKSTMNMNTQNWLLYDRFNPNITANTFELEFNNVGGLVGKSSGSILVDSNASVNTNRRIEW